MLDLEPGQRVVLSSHFVAREMSKIQLRSVSDSRRSAQARNQFLTYTNDEDEAVFIREAGLFTGDTETGKVELTEPIRPDDLDAWKAAPQTSAAFGKTINETNPAVSLVRMNSNEGIFFNTHMDIVVTVEVKGQASEVRQTISLYMFFGSVRPTWEVISSDKLTASLHLRYA
jgi:hypothetical protein